MIINPAFEAYYRGIYKNRWEGLRQGLLEPGAGILYGDGLRSPYYLDRASVLAALSLRLPPDMAEAAGKEEEPPLILDACAAPGGKALIIASRMGSGAVLVANELSARRRRRLALVLDGHLPPEKRGTVKVSGFDAAAEAGRKGGRERFAAVLLDAPCSSERHVIRDQRALGAWTAARPKFLAHRQWALLSAAFLLLRPGGSLVYATCALSPDENDGVVRRLMEKYGGPGGSCTLDRLDFTEGEETAYGRIILPDLSGGAGPLYTARFRKS
ncbi:MAG: 16S rRNA methyltransferase [Treponema sp.]|jgi:16S rRNA (cytosine1407-C5)-methyltransferase|nr:16S rRNA methyltransferase [Treponema sp.]